MATAVVIHDPSGTEPEGELLSGQKLDVARSRGAVVLPVDPVLLRTGAMSGYAKRAYGRGWTYDANRPARGCPLILHADKGYPLLHWVVRLVPGEAGARRDGHLRVAMDTAQPGAVAAGLSPVEGPLNASTLGDPDEHGGWTWRGSSRVTLAGDQFLGLTLYGALSGLRVAWWAVSQG